MIAFDSSMVVAAFGAWHEHHNRALDELSERPRLPGHAALEVYSVLTRLPSPFRAEPSTVAEFLNRTFPSPRLLLGQADQDALPVRLAGLGIASGAAYDAVIAFTAAAAGAELVTLDQRALVTYERCRIRARLVG